MESYEDYSIEKFNEHVNKPKCKKDIETVQTIEEIITMLNEDKYDISNLVIGYNIGDQPAIMSYVGNQYTINGIVKTMDIYSKDMLIEIHDEFNDLDDYIDQ